MCFQVFASICKRSRGIDKNCQKRWGAARGKDILSSPGDKHPGRRTIRGLTGSGRAARHVLQCLRLPPNPARPGQSQRLPTYDPGRRNLPIIPYRPSITQRTGSGGSRPGKSQSQFELPGDSNVTGGSCTICRCRRSADAHCSNCCAHIRNSSATASRFSGDQLWQATAKRGSTDTCSTERQLIGTGPIKPQRNRPATKKRNFPFVVLMFPTPNANNTSHSTSRQFDEKLPKPMKTGLNFNLSARCGKVEPHLCP